MPPPKTPTRTKKLRGTTRRDRVAPNEPEPDVAVPPAPDVLDLEARKEWTRITRELKKLGLIAQVDRAALSIYCQEWSNWTLARRKIQALEAGQDSRQLSIEAREAQKAMWQFISRFGLSPADRAKVSAAKPDDEDDSFAKIMAGK